jgi:hypothetical protein
VIPRWSWSVPCVLLVGWACARGIGEPKAAPAPPGVSSVTETDPSVTATHAPNPAAEPAGESEPTTPCPEGMVLLTRAEGEYCIDIYEASLERRTAAAREPWPGNRTVDGQESEMVAVSRAGVKPQGYISGEQAAAACTNAGKRLCEVDEWVRACRGPDSTVYPYGNQRRAGACNDRYDKLDRHPVVRLFQANAPAGTDPKEMWLSQWMNDPRLHELSDTVTPAGSFPECTNAFGVYDMVGNLHEWVADADGTFLGGFFMDTFQNGEGCGYGTQAHSTEYHDYSTGFRCCADPRTSSALHG